MSSGYYPMISMQRRRNPRIASPLTAHGSMAHDDQKRPGSTSKKHIGLIVVGLLTTIFLVHRLLPGPSSPPLPSYASADLKPKNYLNTTTGVPQNPFPFCPPNGPTDKMAVKYGAGALAQTRTHLGTGYRIQRVLKRALAGQPVTFSIIGGSISACHGAGDSPLSQKCYPSKFFDWWNTIFPHPATEITNGAMRRTNSDYFGYCAAHHIPDVTDLVIVELDADDTPDEDKIQNFEFLIRSLLNRPDQPAVLVLGHFSPQVYQAYRFTGPDHWHDVVAQFYDVPHLSTRPLLFNDYIQDPKSINKFYADPILANPEGHTLLADVLIAYFQSMTCQAWNIATGEEPDPTHTTGGTGKSGGGGGGLLGGIGLRKGVPEPGEDNNKGSSGSDDEEDEDGERTTPKKSSDPRLKIPLGLMTTRPTNDKPFQEIAPYCVSANDLINPLPPSMFYGSGWAAYHPTSQTKQDIEGGATAAHYFYSTLPLSRIRFPIIVSHGDVGIYYLREGKDKLPYGGSGVECWVDDNYSGRTVLGNEAEGTGLFVTLAVIDHNVERGSHFVECQLLGEEGRGVSMFKIIGIFAN